MKHLEGIDARGFVRWALRVGLDQLDREKWAKPFGTDAVVDQVDTALSADLRNLDRLRKEPDDEHLMSTETVAAMFTITPAAVRLAAKEGRLEGEKVGRSWRFTREAVEAWRAA